MLGRVVCTVRLNSSRRSLSQRSYADVPQSAKVISYTSTGSASEVLQIKEEKLPSLGNDQIVVKMLASPINHADLNMVEGTYGTHPDLPAVGGNEGVGVVVAKGSGVSSLKEGDYVIPAVSGLGTWRTAGVFKGKDWISVPKDIKKEYLATLSTPSTALRLLTDFAKLREGDFIIQNGASGAVGSAVVQIAAAKKIKTINIIKDAAIEPESKIERLKSIGGSMAVTASYAASAQFRRLISESSKPKLALNCVGGASATELARSLGDGGTLVTYGGMSHRPVTLPTSLFIFKGINSTGFWLTNWLKNASPQERDAMLQEIYGLVRSDKIKIMMETWSLSRFAGALKRHHEQGRDRKVILTMDNL
eukprot:TRINITY_DN1239_c0_g1_i1.p1 TRINITY_DN1239_c0_g1~~TRINITY_DN1239_c0_g1_i1.p1  ORF type:complete len:363 (-),score=97.36 TRINITY_DN1239_c0_g1_i1:43-1131(-)